MRDEAVTLSGVGVFERSLDDQEGMHTATFDARRVPRCTAGTARVAAAQLAAFLRNHR